MSKQANKTAIGVFVVGAVVLAVAAIIVFGSGKFFVKTDFYVVYLPGSVKGLRIGAPVMFRGVKIGEVTQIRLYSVDKGTAMVIPVIFKVDPDQFHDVGSVVETDEASEEQFLDEMIKMGWRAKMDMQSFVTGQKMINIDFYPDTPVRLLGKEGIDLGDDLQRPLGVGGGILDVGNGEIVGQVVIDPEHDLLRQDPLQLGRRVTEAGRPKSNSSFIAARIVLPLMITSSTRMM